ncbi:MAG: type II secretion system F family protein [Phycisphaerales bacterium]|nr:type II secretion system F family protein [Phycisphaerales bacterium]
MELWRYTAVRTEAGEALAPRRGELMAESAVEVRASLRRIGWQVVELRRARKPITLPIHLRQAFNRHLRRRRRDQRAEIFEGLCSLLESGLPLVECLEVMGEEPARWAGRARRMMLIEWREAMRSGASPAQAMGNHPSWFDGIDCAMVESGQHGGMLPSVLKHMAEREARVGQLGHQLVAALTYPAIITVAAIGVAVFLSIKTLPDLANLLSTAKIEVPALTRWVMAGGQLAAHWGAVLLLAIVVLAAGGVVALRAAVQRSPRAARFAAACTPRVLRTWSVALFARNLADLLRAGVPAVEALRVLSTTLPVALNRVITNAAAEIEAGGDLAQVLNEPLWFSAQFRRLLHSGQAAGELEATLERMAQREERRTERQINRLATLLEPAAILALATLVGAVVLAGVLPLTRLQEMIR